MAWIDPGQRLGRYEVLQLVGQGGLSSIYLARDPALRRNVALKLSSLDTDGELEPRMLLQSEGEILAQLQHPSILKVFDQGEENGRTFLILEYMSAIPESLDRICMKCLSRKPEDRYATAALLAEDLRSWLNATRPRLEAPNRRVFVSHSTKDREFVEREIIAELEKNGIRAWYSNVDIQSAAERETSIRRGLESCEWFLLVMSPRSLSSEWVKDELHWAIDERPNRIVPVLMEDCEPRAFHLRMARIQHMDFRGPSWESKVRLVNLFDMPGPAS